MSDRRFGGGRRWAAAEAATPGQNCGTCHLRDRCPDPRKSRGFRCTLWLEDGDDPSSRDFLDLMRDLVQRETVVPDKYAIDDRDAPLAPNSYQWNCSEHFLNFQPSPYPKQLEPSLRLFGDLCSFCRGPWYDDIPFDCDIREIPRRVMLREYGVCPRCHRTRLDGIAAGREIDYSYYIGLIGQRAGKSTGMTLIISYLVHQLLKLKNPSAFYRIKLGTVLTYTIVGIDYSGAKSNVFDPLVNTMADSPWFQQYAAILKDAEARLGEEEFVKVREKFVFYRNIGLHVAPSSPSRRSLRGKTRIGFAQDEITHFGESEDLVNISGLEVWRALSRSLGTVVPAIRRLRRDGRVHIPPAVGVGIGSTYSITDPGMVLYNAAVADPRGTRILAVRLPTWEANPDITRDDLSTEFTLDPVSAMRDFGCRPPLSANAFMQGLDSFRASVRMGVLPHGTQRTRVVKSRAGTVLTVELTFRKVDRETPRILAIDAGRFKNAFACTVAHLDENRRLVYDMFVEIVPRANASVSFELARVNVIDRIVREMGVVVVISDRWQSYSLSDHLVENLGVESYQHTLKYPDFVAWRDDVVRGAVDVPRPEILPRELLHATGPEMHWLEDKPTAQFIRQGITVVDVPGKTVDKPTKGNDDVFWTGVLAHAGSLLPEIRELLRPTQSQSRAAGAVAAYATATGGRGIMANALATGAADLPPRPVGVGIGSRG